MIISMRGETHSNYQTRRSNVVYTSEWMTVYEDSVSTGDDVTSRRDLLELPGGFIADNEAALDGARRELIEETGYTCNNLKVVNWFYTWPGRTGQKNFVVLGNGLKKHSGKNLDEFEFIKVWKLSENKIILELKNGRIKSALTIAPLFEGYLSSSDLS